MRRAALIPLIVVALALGACGDSDDTDSSSDTTAAAGSDTTATTDGDDSTSESSTATTAASAGGGQFADVCAARDVAAPPTGTETIDYAEAKRNFEKAVASAPSEIKPDMQIVSPPLLQFFSILEQVKGDFAAASQRPEFAAVAAKFNEADYQAAANRIQEWFASNCS